MVILGWPVHLSWLCRARPAGFLKNRRKEVAEHVAWVLGFQGICVGSRDSAGEGSYARSRAGPDGGVRGTAYSATRVKCQKRRSNGCSHGLG